MSYKYRYIIYSRCLGVYFYEATSNRKVHIIMKGDRVRIMGKKRVWGNMLTKVKAHAVHEKALEASC